MSRSPNGGDTWKAITHELPVVLSVEAHTSPDNAHHPDRTPLHLRRLATIPTRELTLDVPSPVTITTTLNTLESLYSMLRGTIRDHVTLERHAFLRFFANMQDITHQSPDTPLPPSILDATSPLIILGALAGG